MQVRVMAPSNRTPRVAIYARVSTRDKDQDPTTQLLPLRDYALAQGWEASGEYVDQAPAGDLAAREAWRELLKEASRRKVDVILVFRIDRAFRSVLHAAQTFERLRGWGVGLRSYSEPWLDTTSPFGEALFHITAAYAQLERAVLAERVRAGMDRVRREGKPIGRPRVETRPGFRRRWAEVSARVAGGELSRRRAAKELGVGIATVARLLAAEGGPGPFEEAGGPILGDGGDAAA
ncbi:MAG TPA: recombinase family protein [Candidatus Nitrosotalea sp.]|nr:recombinase family protein [Candidatus Nitrosotalea sp.]